MKHIQFLTVIAAVYCLGASLHAQSIPDASTPSLEERRLVLEQELEDYRHDLEAAQRDYESAQRELPKAQAAIDSAIAGGRTGATELIWWNQVNRRRAEAQLRIGQLQSRIRGTEAELSRLEVAARQTRKPVSLETGTAKPEVSTAKPGDPVEQEFAKLQGSWPGMYHGLKIEGRNVRIYWRTEENLYSIDARIELDPVKGHMDFHFNNGKVARQLYKWREAQDGKPSFMVQSNLFNPEQRPAKVKMLWEADPQEIDIFQRNPN